MPHTSTGPFTTRSPRLVVAQTLQPTVLSLRGLSFAFDIVALSFGPPGNVTFDVLQLRRLLARLGTSLGWSASRSGFVSRLAFAAPTFGSRFVGVARRGAQVPMARARIVRLWISSVRSHGQPGSNNCT